MPELPEVEVVKLFLEDKLTNQKITRLEILNPKSFLGSPGDVIGQTITKFSRIGKQLSIYLSNGKILLVHLKMSGQLIFQPPLSRGGPEGGGVKMLGHPTKDSLSQHLPNKSTRIIFRFSKVGAPLAGARLFFNDQRKFGWIKVFDNLSQVEASQSHLGHDIFDSRFTPNYLFSQLHRSSRAVKLVLLDQHFFAGIGNIYANDALFLSAIHPTIPANQITLKQCQLIHRHLISIMQQSVLAGGSTAKDNKYVRPDGSYGANQFYFRVYQRAGEPCLKCSTPVKSIRLGGRGTFFCPHCQK
ncbi:bifunctional DNA-formamidopyrimidine glycosylase/DNA-(apurinic or apyrimidinic site) lyase [Candidatus Shapirobacteria bacterium]|nr:bifunctional DNA-formamidopyrimidine glycosylase/DNA-(apurinic or apyrimidinic site) lyase [Candidatus Shapirobacteria bacterium]